VVKTECGRVVMVDILPGVNARGFLTLHGDVPQVVLPSLCVRKRVVAMPYPDFVYILRCILIAIVFDAAIQALNRADF
jgi:hypothetical protein